MQLHPTGEQIIKVRCKDCRKKLSGTVKEVNGLMRCPACKAQPFEAVPVDAGAATAPISQEVLAPPPIQVSPPPPIMRPSSVAQPPAHRPRARFQPQRPQPKSTAPLIAAVVCVFVAVVGGAVFIVTRGQPNTDNQELALNKATPRNEPALPSPSLDGKAQANIPQEPKRPVDAEAPPHDPPKPPPRETPKQPPPKPPPVELPQWDQSAEEEKAITAFRNSTDDTGLAQAVVALGTCALKETPSGRLLYYYGQCQLWGFGMAPNRKAAVRTFKKADAAGSDGAADQLRIIDKEISQAEDDGYSVSGKEWPDIQAHKLQGMGFSGSRDELKKAVCDEILKSMRK